MKHYILLLLAAAGLSLSLQAQQRPSRVPAFRGVIARVQPDGDTIRTYLRGDERSHFTMTIDGWQIMENKKGFLCYAVKKRGEVKVSRRVAHDADKRSRCENRFLRRKGIQKTVHP